MTNPISGIDEYRTLANALEDTKPHCANDDRFTADPENLTDDDNKQMRTICRHCPLAELCRDYATTARPKAGMWAGKHWGTKTRKATA